MKMMVTSRSIGWLVSDPLPSGELTFCHGKSPFLMGKSIISMASFHCFLLVHQRVISGDFNRNIMEYL